MCVRQQSPAQQSIRRPNVSTTKHSRISKGEVDRFIVEKIESVPHMEALLLIWETRPQQWSESDLAERLFVRPEAARRIMRDLVTQGLVSASKEGSQKYSYPSASPARDDLMKSVAETYRSELVRVSGMIHSKASGALREFARAFEFGRKKE